MPQPVPISSPAIDALAREAFADAGCESYGVTVMRGAKSWGAHETGGIALPGADGPLELRVSYDEREAPFVTCADGREDPRSLVSLADEGEAIACAWAQRQEGSPLLGVGIDLASTSDFDERPFTQRFIQMVFSSYERELAAAGWPDDLAMGYATAFGAKEAAFKATAAPLRTWYRSHEEKLSFEVRHFCLVSPHEAQGIMRNGAAQRAMRKMGIAHISVHYAQVDGMALVVATALA